MTRDGGFKKLVRDRARRAGESYSTARAHLRRRSASADAELVTRCAAPIVRRMHAADQASRDAVVPGLTRDQGTLLAFWILNSHASDGLTGLCRVHPHRLSDPGFWTLLEIGLREHSALLASLARLRVEVAGALERTTERGDFGWLDHLDPDVMRELDEEFQVVMPGSLHRMADHIRAHPGRFPIIEVGR